MTSKRFDAPVVVSACLLGKACRYDGKDNLVPKLEEYLHGREVLAVCPEEAGGLPTPRPPAEIVGNKVLRENGEDVTAAFAAGVEASITAALNSQAQSAILKARSPSCGCGQIYNGEFNGTLVEGDGLFTRALKSNGISCQTEDDIP